MFSFVWPIKKSIDVNRERSIIGNLSIGIASVSFFVFLAQLVILVFLAIFLPDLAFTTTSLLIVNAVTMYGIAMPCALIYFKRCPTAKHEERPLGFLMMICAILVSFAVFYLGGILGSRADELAADLLGRNTINPVSNTVEQTSLLETLLFVVLLAPIAEEIFYRKLFIDRLRRYGDVPAIIISGLVFGLIHGNLSQFFYAAMLGIVFGAVYVYTGRLRYTIFLHILINFMGTFYTSLMLEKLGGGFPDVITPEFIAEHSVGYQMATAYSLLNTVSFYLAVPALFYFLTKFTPKKGVVTLVGEDSRNVVLKSPGFWLGLLYLVGSFALGIVGI